MPTTEIGESSSPPPPLTVSDEDDKFYGYDMYDDYDLVAHPNTPTRTKWAENTIHAAGELARNPSDPRRTRSQFESSLFVKDPLFVEKCYKMVELDTQTYEEASEYPRCQTTMKEEYHSL